MESRNNHIAEHLAKLWKWHYGESLEENYQGLFELLQGESKSFVKWVQYPEVPKQEGYYWVFTNKGCLQSEWRDEHFECDYPILFWCELPESPFKMGCK